MVLKSTTCLQCIFYGIYKNNLEYKWLIMQLLSKEFFKKIKLFSFPFFLPHLDFKSV